jgi:hypothetical protein
MEGIYLELKLAYFNFEWRIVNLERAAAHLEGIAWKIIAIPRLIFVAIPCFMRAMSDARRALPGDLLKATSRSFYLTLRVLSAAVRPKSARGFFPACFPAESV